MQIRTSAVPRRRAEPNGYRLTKAAPIAARARRVFAALSATAHRYARAI
jgi:hypothetical protein